MKVFYAGSFDPFTIGHRSIVDRALAMFGGVVIGVGVNTGKKPWQPLAERLAAIRALYAGDPRVEVTSYEGLTCDAARACGAGALLRGVRTVADFEYERNLADVNRNISGLESVLLLALPELASVSSSLVRELAAFGAPYDRFLPKIRGSF
ncbi:MAG: pantetheine-phosphate adenylyltransferase [Muribaculaceae bacterium]|nr:pantetheine-phosphate adenylyltransferase [Muribaculaceae bacterium]